MHKFIYPYEKFSPDESELSKCQVIPSFKLGKSTEVSSPYEIYISFLLTFDTIWPPPPLQYLKVKVHCMIVCTYMYIYNHINIFCQPTFICLWDILARFPKALLSRIQYKFLPQTSLHLCQVLIKVSRLKSTFWSWKISHCEQIYL